MTGHEAPVVGGSGSQASPGLSVLVNGDAQRVPLECNLEQLLSLLEMSNRRVAVAVNQTVVAHSSYATLKLSNGDRVEILEAVGGG